MDGNLYGESEVNGDFPSVGMDLRPRHTMHRVSGPLDLNLIIMNSSSRVKSLK